MAKGQTIGVAVVLMIFIFIFGMLFLNFIKPNIVDARTALSCSADTISDGTKIVCLFVDTTLPYWILIVLSITGGILLNRLLI